MVYDPLRVFRKLARNNRLANLRLHTSCLHLKGEELIAPRASFFPTIRLTLNHIHLVDLFYLDALKGGALGYSVFSEDEPFTDMAKLHEAQSRLDDELIAFVDALTPQRLCMVVEVRRAERVQLDQCDDILSHLFQHQTHHRGQVHAMLSATSVSPPQLDEFIVSDDSGLRKSELKSLGWTESDLMFPGRNND